jgi:hypothetical protein
MSAAATDEAARRAPTRGLQQPCSGAYNTAGPRQRELQRQHGRWYNFIGYQVLRPCRWTIGPAPLAAVPGQSRAGEGFTPSAPHSGSPRVRRGGLVPSPRCTMATRTGVATLVR